MTAKTLQIPIPAGVRMLEHMARLSANALPGALSSSETAQTLGQTRHSGPDLTIGDTGLWVLDPAVQFSAPPTMACGPSLNGPGADPSAYFFPGYLVTVGRSAKHNGIALPHEHVSHQHLRLQLYQDLVRIQNTSGTNGVFIGSMWLRPAEMVFVRPDSAFIITLGASASKLSGALLISPLMGEFTNVKRDHVDPFADMTRMMRGRLPWATNYVHHVMQQPVEVQATTPDGTIVTPTQVRFDDIVKQHGAELNGEAGKIRSFIRGWINNGSGWQNGNLQKHFQGKHNWHNRLRDNMRNGGILLPTHSTDLDGTIAILESGEIDPKYFRAKRAFFRYGFGHSYGQITFVQKPGTENLGTLHDIFYVRQPSIDQREDLMHLVQTVKYNRDIEVTPMGDERNRPAGRTVQWAREPFFRGNGLMELFPQFESSEPVPTSNTCAILVPEHLYDELMKAAPEEYHDLIIKIPGTGATKKEFLKGVKKRVARRRRDGGNFQPKIGYDALYRMELTYFKIVEMVQRYRHRALRARLEEFAHSAADGKLSHTDIVNRIAELTPLLPEPFYVLHMRKQYPSQDGHSPLGHTMNALIEAAYLAPALAREFPEFHVADVFIALLYHDLGKIHGARDDDHDQHSVEMAKHHLKMMDLLGDQSTPENIERGERILFLIERAGLISEAIMMRQGIAAGRSHALVINSSWDSIARQLLPRANGMLPELFLFNFADTASIPGRSGRKMLKKKRYHPVLDVRRNLIEAFREFLKRQG